MFLVCHKLRKCVMKQTFFIMATLFFVGCTKPIDVSDGILRILITEDAELYLNGRKSDPQFFKKEFNALEGVNEVWYHREHKKNATDQDLKKINDTVKLTYNVVLESKIPVVHYDKEFKQKQKLK